MAHQRVHEILAEKRPVLDHLTGILEEREVLSGDEVKKIIADMPEGESA